MRPRLRDARFTLYVHHGVIRLLRLRYVSSLTIAAVFRLQAIPRGGDFALIAGADFTLRLLVAGFTRLLLTLQTFLTRLETRFSLSSTLRFEVDSAQLGFFLAVILHQGNITGADISTGAAFDAVINMM